MSTSRPGEPPPLVFEQVSKRYNGVSAIDALSLTVHAHSFVALVGASGSGKSTLLRLINRLEIPEEGRVLIDGRDIAQSDPVSLRRSIGYVFQHVGLFPHMTVAENIGIIPRIAGGVPTDVASALVRVGLPDRYADRMPAMLSGGEQQRVGIARALAGSPRFLLMDEPFGALDPVTRDNLGQTVRSLHDRLGLTTVLVTHDMAEALMLADRVIVMSRGRIVADAPPNQMLAGGVAEEARALVSVARRQAERLMDLGR